MSAALQPQVTPSKVKGLLTHAFASAYYYNQGCPCDDCRTAASTARTTLRRKHRADRIVVDGVLIHPALHPVDSVETPRHGTVYARREYGCECRPCKYSRRTGNWGCGIAAGHLTLWHLAEWFVAAASLAGLLILWRFYASRTAALSYMVPPSRITHTLLAAGETVAGTGSSALACVYCVFAAVWHGIARLSRTSLFVTGILRRSVR